jgi:hypothetical protein
MAQAARASGAAQQLVFLLTVAMSAVTLVVAWSRRDTGDLTAETGWGYALGIVGGLILLTLLIYPMRKRLPMLRRIGTIPYWFRLHMLMGVFGPVLIVVHSNFNLGSLNSGEALFAMLVDSGQVTMMSGTTHPD